MRYRTKSREERWAEAERIKQTEAKIAAAPSGHKAGENSSPLTGSEKEAGIAYVSDILVDVRLKGNRWNFLRAIISPRVAHIRLRQYSAAIFVNPPPSQNEKLNDSGPSAGALPHIEVGGKT